jgi:hypothetical protein
LIDIARDHPTKKDRRNGVIGKMLYFQTDAQDICRQLPVVAVLCLFTDVFPVFIGPEKECCF